MTTRDEQPHSTVPAARSLPLPAPIVPGADWRTEWCTTCKAWTRLTGSVVMLTPYGLATAGTWAWCEICDDPADQEVRHG